MTSAVGGTTPSESYLARLCASSFLRLWSYPNLYRDQRWGGRTEGKELCDLLVVFGNDLIIFSDKDCAFPESGDLKKDWSRWFKRAVWHSAQQIAGAERWLKQFPDRVFVDPTCRTPLPIKLPDPASSVVHRIIVAHGSGPRCRRELGGNGSLMLAPLLVGKAHFEPVAAVLPFTIGLADPSVFFHVIDDFTLDVLLGTVDTIRDFTMYLRKKEEFVLSGRLISAAGEEELLAWYLRHYDESQGHYFKFPEEAAGVILEEGFWESFSQHPERLHQIAADRVSYSWDCLIDKFAYHALAGTQHFPTDTPVRELEIALRFMAREPRVRRRQLTKSLFALMDRGDREERAVRVNAPSSPGDPYYIFLTLKPRTDRSQEEYRKVRRNLLEAYCLVVRRKFPDAQDVVGIGTEPSSFGDRRSEDLLYLDGRHWTPELDAEAADLQQRFGLLQEVRRSATTEPEYPCRRDLAIQKGRNRNSPCTCGSGRKYKKCCGAASRDI
jgi:SEC-C motif-containing protein